MKQISNNEIKKIQLEILIEFSKFCNENNISYFLAYGSLIGAVRHKGFIPWDDDIDIVIPRNDYNILIETFNSKKNKYKISTFTNNPGYEFSHAKIEDISTLIIENNKSNLGINIDIFPLDGVPSNPYIASFHMYKCKLIRKLIGWKRISYDNSKNIYKKKSLFILQLFFSFLPINYLLRIIDRVSQKYKFEDSKYVANLVWGTYYKKEKINKYLFEEKIELIFQNHLFAAPLKYDIILRQIYGDYLKLPPVEKQKTHHNFKAFWV